MALRFSLNVFHAQDLGLVPASDQQVFLAAREAGAVLVTKDRDFVKLLGRMGRPPQILWVTCGNTSNRRMRVVMESSFGRAAALFAAGEPMVEVKG
jgi:predicted nuclease of predicted toxin-antitoxin system